MDVEPSGTSAEAVEQKRPRGRRPGASSTRSAILAAARRRFSVDGYAGTSIRAIAQDAAVDPALVAHYYGGKRSLFEAALELPAHLDAAIRAALSEDRRCPGNSVVRDFVDACDRWPGLAALVRASVTDDTARRWFADFLVLSVVAPLSASFESRRTKLKLRANLIAAQLIGLVFVRSIVPADSVAAASSRTLATVYGPAITAILTGVDFTL